jgi:chromosome segregation ATPase
MSRLPDLADRIERLLLRHDEQKRTSMLLEQQLRNVTDERDNLRSRLAAARARIDALIDRLPAEVAQVAAGTQDAGSPGAAGNSANSGISGNSGGSTDEAGRPVRPTPPTPGSAP